MFVTHQTMADSSQEQRTQLLRQCLLNAPDYASHLNNDMDTLHLPFLSADPPLYEYYRSIEDEELDDDDTSSFNYGPNQRMFNAFFRDLDLFDHLETLVIKYGGMYSLPTSLHKFRHLRDLTVECSRLWFFDMRLVPRSVRRLTISAHNAGDIKWELNKLPPYIEYLSISICMKEDTNWPVLPFYKHLKEIRVEGYWYGRSQACDTAFMHWLKMYPKMAYDTATSIVTIGA